MAKQKNIKGLSFAEQLALTTGQKIPKVKKRSMNRQQFYTIETNDAPASVIGNPFYNPYTFIPFPQKAKALERKKVTPITIDEKEKDRISGVIKLEIKTISPLLAQSHTPYQKQVDGKNYNYPFDKNVDKEKGHLFYKAMTIDKDVIIPATSVRGSLRSLLSTIIGGSLGYVDENLFLLPQARDVHLGPVKTGNGLKNVFLAEIGQTGSATQFGTIFLGETKLVSTKKLTVLFSNNNFEIQTARPSTSKESYWIDNYESPTRITQFQSSETPWKVKLSGQKITETPAFKVKRDGKSVKITKYKIDSLITRCRNKVWINDPQNPTSAKSFNDKDHTFFVQYDDRRHDFEIKGIGTVRDGVFKRAKDAEPILLNSSFWLDYQGRNRHGEHKELESGDLVWLELVGGAEFPKQESDIKSLQWARWGRGGDRVKDVISEQFNHILPDYLQKDGKVDVVTDLFGQVVPKKLKGEAFAARVRPSNLVFEDGTSTLLKEVTLPLLSSPNPGCIPFYREGVANNIGVQSTLRGYKVYRNSKDNDSNAPWLYKNQGVYDESGKLKNQYQHLNKTVDLVNKEIVGKLNIAFRSLTESELALLLLICDVNWKLGGGKPLGLGQCKVENTTIINELGEPIFSKDVSNKKLSVALTQHKENFAERIEMYQASQSPVEMLRYPRAVKKSNQNIRGGHIWFNDNAKVKMNSNKSEIVNILTDGALKNQVKSDYISGQVLSLDYSKPLYGYDCFAKDDGKSQDRSHYGKLLITEITKFDENKHITGGEKSKGNHSQNHKTRQSVRDQRSSEPSVPIAPTPIKITKKNILKRIKVEMKAENFDSEKALYWIDELKKLGMYNDGRETYKDIIKKLEEDIVK